MAALWPYEEAERIKKNLGPDVKKVVFEAGFGPSGLPHVGTFCEVSRPTFVRKAFMKVFQGAIVGGLFGILISIVAGLVIPDPFGCCRSFAHHMEDKLRGFLDSFGFDYEFKSAAEEYAKGAFNAGLVKALENAEKIRNIIIPTMRKEDREQWSPFMPICESCGRTSATRTFPPR